MSIQQLVKKTSQKLGNVDGDNLMFSCNQDVQAIENWKAHRLRSHRQDKARLDIIDLLKEDTIFVTQDWAMNFLPQKYRETQADWFGKRGISWHISVVVRRSKEGKLESQSFIHIAKIAAKTEMLSLRASHTLYVISRANIQK